MDWYVIQAYSGYEQKVKAALEEKIELNNLAEKFGEILIPTEQIVELKGGSKKTTERKFFPGYILVQMILEDDSWQLVQSTPRVSGFVGGTKEEDTPQSQTLSSLFKPKLHFLRFTKQQKQYNFITTHLRFTLYINDT